MQKIFQAVKSSEKIKLGNKKFSQKKLKLKILCKKKKIGRQKVSQKNKLRPIKI